MQNLKVLPKRVISLKIFIKNLFLFLFFQKFGCTSQLKELFQHITKNITYILVALRTYLSVHDFIACIRHFIIVSNTEMNAFKISLQFF